MGLQAVEMMEKKLLSPLYHVNMENLSNQLPLSCFAFDDGYNSVRTM